MSPAELFEKNPLADATAYGLMSQAETFHPWRWQNKDKTPLPVPISRHFLPFPGPSFARLSAMKSVSSLGG